MQVLARLAPFERGIYEDYVANFWCTTSVLIKWKKLFDTQSLKLLSLAATVSTCLPSMVQQIKYPSNKGFLFALLNSSLSFYFFSFQGSPWFIYRLIDLYIVISLLRNYQTFVYWFGFCLQFMRSQSYFLFYLQAYWLLKNLMFTNGLHTLAYSRCFHSYVVTNLSWHISHSSLSSMLSTLHQI